MAITCVLATLGGDKHHPIAGARTIDSSRGSVLEDLDALNVFGRHRGHRRHGNPINHIERLLAGRQRTRTTNRYLHIAPSTSVGAQDLYPRYFPLHGLHHVRNGYILQLLLVHRGHSSCEFTFTHGAIAHHHCLAYGHIAGLHHHVELGAVAHGDLLGGHAHVDELQHRLRARHRDAVAPL